METKVNLKKRSSSSSSNINFKGNMQKIAKALMIPIVILPFAAIFLAIGDMAGIDFFKVAGETIIQDYLPLLFAVGFAISFTNNDGYAGFAAVCGHVVMVGVMKSINPGMTLEDGTFLPNDMSVLGGIIAGVYTTILFHKFKDIKFPEFLGLFSGKRFVPIITAVVSVAFGVFFGYTWPYVNNMINSLAVWIFNTGEYGIFVYGVLNRLLIPTGLHHIQQNILMHVLGNYTVDGALVTGELARFYAGDTSAGFFTGGFFAIMGFALPAAALAMYHEAKSKNKKKVAGMMVTVSLTSIVIGITEPIEFMFMFTAPLLFLAHALLTGGVLTISALLGIRHYGYAMPMFFINMGYSENPWLIFPLGIAAAIIYYFTFRFLIRKFNYITPGREEETQVETKNIESSELVNSIVDKLGGLKNLQYVDACLTRLRITVYDGSKINIEELKKLPLSGVSRLDQKNYQLIFGSTSDKLKEEILVLMGEKINKIVSPITGEIIPLEEISDEVFAKGLVGKGIGIIPMDETLFAPCSGTVETVNSTEHGLIMTTDRGLNILFHIGINTVELDGEGFDLLVQKGDKIEKGQPLVKFDLKLIEDRGYSTESVMLLLNSDCETQQIYLGKVQKGKREVLVVETLQ